MSYGEQIALRTQAELNEVASAALVGVRSTAEDLFLERTEDQFLEKLKRHYAAAFEQLVAERTGDIYALLFRLTSDAEEARDLTQETFLRAFQAIEKFRGDADLKTWLYRIAVNQARNRHRFWRRRHRADQVSLDQHIAAHGEFLSGGESTPDRILAQKELAERLQLALEHLPFDQRTAIILREIDGLSYEEIASVMNCPIGTVRSRIFRARETIADRLRPLLETSKDKRW